MARTTEARKDAIIGTLGQLKELVAQASQATTVDPHSMLVVAHTVRTYFFHALEVAEQEAQLPYHAQEIEELVRIVGLRDAVRVEEDDLWMPVVVGWRKVMLLDALSPGYNNKTAKDSPRRVILDGFKLTTPDCTPNYGNPSLYSESQKEELIRYRSRFLNKLSDLTSAPDTAKREETVLIDKDPLYSLTTKYFEGIMNFLVQFEAAIAKASLPPPPLGPSAMSGSFAAGKRKRDSNSPTLQQQTTVENATSVRSRTSPTTTPVPDSPELFHPPPLKKPRLELKGHENAKSILNVIPATHTEEEFDLGESADVVAWMENGALSSKEMLEKESRPPSSQQPLPVNVLQSRLKKGAENNLTKLNNLKKLEKEQDGSSKPQFDSERAYRAGSSPRATTSTQRVRGASSLANQPPPSFHFSEGYASPDVDVPPLKEGKVAKDDGSGDNDSEEEQPSEQDELEELSIERALLPRGLEVKQPAEAEMDQEDAGESSAGESSEEEHLRSDFATTDSPNKSFDQVAREATEEAEDDSSQTRDILRMVEEDV
ncbi:hypothetical protein T439DRAFT_376331 [Meredithblackwellia eburnea MCA 4105]